MLFFFTYTLMTCNTESEKNQSVPTSWIWVVEHFMYILNSVLLCVDYTTVTFIFAITFVNAILEGYHFLFTTVDGALASLQCALVDKVQDNKVLVQQKVVC